MWTRKRVKTVVSNIYELLLIYFCNLSEFKQRKQNKPKTQTLCKLSKKILEKNTPQKLWGDKRTECRGILKKNCKEKIIEVHLTMSETKAAFAESAIQSLKQKIYRPIEDLGKKFKIKLPQFVSTRICHVLRSIGKSVRDVKNTDLKKNTSHNLQIKILKIRQYLQNSLLHTFSKISTKEEVLGKFYEKQLRKCSDSRLILFKTEFLSISFPGFFFTIELVSRASFNCYPNKSLGSFTSFLPEQTHLKEEWEVAVSEIIYPTLY